ncbi:hypothetical protein F5Y00DRAFT_271783 [Daldinia vernicosa]|uniref:uncharacterized protein n=1 Tax=Daldinia vernicosa TaxID=114800 RepID=UPI00200820F4|nr:uncharacterized protein F5Y00DRAFT_271783 [Daldinia vernicosa]KAI0846655.1 hypothetical protein F5Y00DRAFT_271783 [Daldinia vernicosa]
MASETALTFGVELEFMVTVNYKHHRNQAALWAMTELFMRNLKDLEASLPCAGITAKLSKTTGQGYQSHYPASHKVIPIKKKEWKDHYCFSEDVTVYPNFDEEAELAEENKRAVGLEVSTRVLDFDKQGCPELKTAFAAVRNGGELTNKEIAEEFKPSAHSTAGLHVHVGVKDGLSLETARNAAVLGWLLEPCLFSLCDANRGMNWQHAPIRKNSVLSQCSSTSVQNDMGVPDSL